MATSTTVAAGIVRASFDQARSLRSRIVGQEHVLLALADRDDAVGTVVLEKLGLADGLGVLSLWITPGTTNEANPEPTVRLVKALEEADTEAEEHQRPATSADLVIGIMRAGIGVGYQLLRSAGVSLDGARAARDEVLQAPHAELETVTESSLVALLR